MPALPALSSAQHILVIQPLVGIGDMIWHKPWIDKLIKDYRVTLMAKPSVQADVIFEGASESFTLLKVDRTVRGKRGYHDGLFGFMRIVSEMRKTEADTAIILHHSPRYALAARLAGIPYRLGYGIGRQKAHLNAGQFLDKKTIDKHAIDRVRQFANQNGFGLSAPEWKISARKTAITRANQLLRSWKFITGQQTITTFLCIGIGSMNSERQWGAQNFAELVSHLLKQRPDLNCLILGGPDEKAIADDIITKLYKAGIRLPPVFLGRLDEAVALMTLSSGYVGNDTSLLNFMACVQKPAVGLFSESRPLEYSPYLHKTDALQNFEYGQAGIIQKITPSDVLEKIHVLWPCC